MSKHETNKNTFKGKMETIARRTQRAAKYKGAMTMTRSGRARTTEKGAW